jgi:hypothetical protein
VAKLARALRALALGIAAVMFNVAPAPAVAQDGVRLAEQDIKAGLLYNFLRYTEWPPRSGEAVVLCVFGGDPFSGRLTPMSGRTVNGQAIRLRFIDAQTEIEGCSMLFVNAEERAAWPGLRTYLTRRHVLTVSDYDGFARSGGMIEFTRANNRVGMRINVGAAQAANLVVQDRLLRLGSVVQTDRP